MWKEPRSHQSDWAEKWRERMKRKKGDQFLFYCSWIWSFSIYWKPTILHNKVWSVDGDCGGRRRWFHRRSAEHTKQLFSAVWMLTTASRSLTLYFSRSHAHTHTRARHVTCTRTIKHINSKSLMKNHFMKQKKKNRIVLFFVALYWSLSCYICLFDWLVCDAQSAGIQRWSIGHWSFFLLLFV